MIKLRYIVSTATLLAVMMPGTTKAAIEGVSFLNIYDFRLFVDTDVTGDGVPDGVPGAPITLGVHVAFATPPLYTSAASANIFSIPGGPVATVAGSPAPAIGLDTAIAQEGSAFADDAAFPPPFGPGPVGPALFNPAAPLPHAFADTTGFGTSIAGVPATPFGAFVAKTSQADLSPLAFFDIGTADASDTGTNTFTIVPLVPLSIIGVFDAEQYLLADLTPAPPGAAASASTSLSITIALGGGTVFSWAPDGLPGGIVGGVEYSDPFSLNASITTAPGSTNGPLYSSTLPVVGPPPPGPNPGPFFAAGVTLAPGFAYSFTITESTSADVSAVGAIPEPVSVIVWALLALCGGAAANYRFVRSA